MNGAYLPLARVWMKERASYLPLQGRGHKEQLQHRISWCSGYRQEMNWSLDSALADTRHPSVRICNVYKIYMCVTREIFHVLRSFFCNLSLDFCCWWCLTLTLLPARRRGLRGRRKRREVRRKVWTLLKVQLGQGCWMRGTGENMGDCVGFHFIGAEGARD